MEQFLVYSKMGNYTYTFPDLAAARLFYEKFPSDSRLVDVDGETILAEKKVLTSDNWHDFIRAGIYVLKLRRGLPDLTIPGNDPALLQVSREDLAIYQKLLDQLRSNKGVFLNGQVGCGKTTAFEFFNMARLSGYLPDIKPLRIISSVGLATGYQQKGFDIFDEMKLGASYEYDVVLDDLGAEITMGKNGYIKHYGDSLQVLAHVIYIRHAAYVATGLKTHFTSNLEFSDIAHHYSDKDLGFDRLSSRIEESCEIISMITDSKRKA